MATIAGFLVAASAAAIGAAALADRKTQTPTDPTLRQNAIALPGAVPVVAEEGQNVEQEVQQQEVQQQDEGQNVEQEEDPQNVQQGGAIGRPPWGEITMTSTGPVSLETGKPMTVQFTGIPADDLFNQMTQAQRERDELELKLRKLDKDLSDIVDNPKDKATDIAAKQSEINKLQANLSSLRRTISELRGEYDEAPITRDATTPAEKKTKSELDAMLKEKQVEFSNIQTELDKKYDELPIAGYTKLRMKFARYSASLYAANKTKIAYEKQLEKSLNPKTRDEFVSEKMAEWEAESDTNRNAAKDVKNRKRAEFIKEFGSVAKEIDQTIVDGYIDRIRQADETIYQLDQQTSEIKQKLDKLEAKKNSLVAQIEETKTNLKDAIERYKKAVDSYRATVKFTVPEADKPSVYVKPKDLDERKKELVRRFNVYSSAKTQYESFMGSQYYPVSKDEEERKPLEPRKAFLESKLKLAERNYTIASQNLTRRDALPFEGEAPPVKSKSFLERVGLSSPSGPAPEYEKEWTELINSLFKPTDVQKQALLKPDIFPVLKILSEPYDASRMDEYNKVLGDKALGFSKGGAQIFANRLFNLTDLYSDCFIQVGDTFKKADGTPGTVKDLKYNNKGVCNKIVSSTDGKAIDVSDITLESANPSGDSGRIFAYLEKLKTSMLSFSSAFGNITDFILGTSEVSAPAAPGTAPAATSAVVGTTPEPLPYNATYCNIYLERGLDLTPPFRGKTVTQKKYEEVLDTVVRVGGMTKEQFDRCLSDNGVTVQTTTTGGANDSTRLRNTVYALLVSTAIAKRRFDTEVVRDSTIAKSVTDRIASAKRALQGGESKWTSFIEDEMMNPIFFNDYGLTAELLRGIFANASLTSIVNALEESIRLQTKIIDTTDNDELKTALQSEVQRAKDDLKQLNNMIQSSRIAKGDKQLSSGVSAFQDELIRIKNNAIDSIVTNLYSLDINVRSFLRTSGITPTVPPSGLQQAVAEGVAQARAERQQDTHRIVTALQTTQQNRQNTGRDILQNALNASQGAQEPYVMGEDNPRETPRARLVRLAQETARRQQTTTTAPPSVAPPVATVIPGAPGSGLETALTTNDTEESPSVRPAAAAVARLVYPNDKCRVVVANWLRRQPDGPITQEAVYEFFDANPTVTSGQLRQCLEYFRVNRPSILNNFESGVALGHRPPLTAALTPPPATPTPGRQRLDVLRETVIANATVPTGDPMTTGDRVNVSPLPRPNAAQPFIPTTPQGIAALARSEAREAAMRNNLQQLTERASGATETEIDRALADIGTPRTGGFRNHVTRRHRPVRMFKARKTWRT